jgi:16S rRNA (cytosine967-C5)-methyltransferase
MGSACDLASALAPLAESLRSAALIVARVAAGRSLSAELLHTPDEATSASRAALTDLCFGTLRSYGRVQAIVRHLARRADIEPAVESLLWCALYAFRSKRFAAYTIVDQAVRACDLLGKTRAKGFVNATLRAYLRQERGLEARVAADPVARWQHPAWWITRVQRDHGPEWQRILEAGNEQAPMCLRVNPRRTAVDTYQRRLAETGMAARACGSLALLLEHPCPVSRLPAFAEGEVSIQDLGAQRTASLLDLQPGQRVLDACAAPGGKSAQILERENVELTALELQAARADVVRNNLARLGLAAEVRVADCSRLDTWWDGRPFDRVLADVPCTASGVARRHPDIKWLRREADVAACAARQAQILGALWRVLAPGGKLLYVTCSVFREENDAVVEAFLASAPAARRLPLPDGGPRQLLPSPEHDGFYFALLGNAA